MLGLAAELAEPLPTADSQQATANIDSRPCLPSDQNASWRAAHRSGAVPSHIKRGGQPGPAHRSFAAKSEAVHLHA